MEQYHAVRKLCNKNHLFRLFMMMGYADLPQQYFNKGTHCFLILLVCIRLQYSVFSCRDGSKLVSVERSINAKSCRADICTYELTKSCIHRTHHTSVPLSSNLVRVKWDHNLQNLIASCEDNSLLLYR